MIRKVNLLKVYGYRAMLNQEDLPFIYDIDTCNEKDFKYIWANNKMFYGAFLKTTATFFKNNNADKFIFYDAINKKKINLLTVEKSRFRGGTDNIIPNLNFFQSRKIYEIRASNTPIIIATSDREAWMVYKKYYVNSN